MTRKNKIVRRRGLGRRNGSRRGNTDAGADARMPRVPWTLPRVTIPPSLPQFVEVTQMKREWLRLNATPATALNVSAPTVVAALTTTGVTAITFTIHEIEVYQLNPGEGEAYVPLQVIHNPTGYQVAFYGVPGVKAPSGKFKLPSTLSLPIRAVSPPTETIFSILGASLVRLDVSYVTKNVSLSSSLPEFSLRQEESFSGLSSFDLQ
jgi:hypothetical protein